jgi:hypothetical protein
MVCSKKISTVLHQFRGSILSHAIWHGGTSSIHCEAWLAFTASMAREHTGHDVEIAHRMKQDQNTPELPIGLSRLTYHG